MDGRARGFSAALITLALSLTLAGERAWSQDALKDAFRDFQAGDNGSAQQRLTVLLEKDPANAPAHNLLGLVLMKQRQFSEAKREFETAVRLQPASAAGHTNLGNALVQLHSDANARLEYQRSLAIAPEDELALENLGLLEARAQHYREAAGYLRRAHLLKPEDLTVSAALAASLISDGKFSDAEALIPELRQAGEAAGASRYSLALLALDSGNAELGSRFVADDAVRQRAFQAAAIERARSVSAAKRYPEAVRILTAIRDLKPERADLHDLLGTIYYELDQPKQATVELEEAIRLEPREVEHYYKLGMMFLKHRTPEGALYVFEAALKVLPNDHQVWMGLGLSNYIKGDLTTAKADLYHALSLRPGDGPTYTVLCDLLTQSHQDQELLSTIGDALRAQPDNYLLRYYYGRALATNDAPLAILELQKSIRLNPQFPLSQYELGRTLAQKGNLAAAIDALERSIQLSPNLLEAHYQLGQIYRRMGQQRLAEREVAVVKRILKDGSADEVASRLLFTIEK